MIDVMLVQPLKQEALIVVRLDANVTEANAVQFLNVFVPIFVIDDAIVIDVKPEPWNVASFRAVTPDGIDIVVKPVQPLNAKDPMLVTPDGRVKEVKPAQLLNAEAPMLVTPAGIDIDVKPDSLANILSFIAVADPGKL